MSRRFNLPLKPLTALLLIVSAFAFSSANAETQDLNCASGPALSESIKAIQNENETWMKTHPLTASQNDLNASHEGRRVELFSAELLAKSNFSELYKQCWVYLIDFQNSLEFHRALGEKKLKSPKQKAIQQTQISSTEQNDLFEKWDNCVSVSLKPLPVEASELKTCWGKISGHSGL